LKNVGKIFEEDFKKSFDETKYMVHRLKDTAQSYNKSKDTSFTWDNPCDFFIYSSNSKTLYAIENKSTKYKSMTFDREYVKDSTKMIKYHQIDSLTTLSEYNGIIAGLVLNFRDEDDNTQRTYFQDIRDFRKMINDIDKKSFNEIDLILHNGKKIEGQKKRVRYRWSFDNVMP